MTSVATASSSMRLSDDALRELVNIGAGRALSALSRLVQDAVVTMSPVKKGHSGLVKAQPGVVIGLSVDNLPLRFLLAFGHGAGADWAARMMGRAGGDSLGELEQSALLELGNIMSCAFLDAIAAMTRVRLVPGLPSLRVGALDTLLADERAALRTPTIAWTRFVLRDTRTSGRLVMLADPAAKSTLVRAVLG